VAQLAFAELPLEQRRERLIVALGEIAARVELTVVFDGSKRVTGLPPAPRGVRVLFSRRDEDAGTLINQIVRAEEAIRLVVVISSDRKVADDARRHGAYPMIAELLLPRLNPPGGDDA
jgi:predicted RNA-binding protein with PIN domain